MAVELQHKWDAVQQQAADVLTELQRVSHCEQTLTVHCWLLTVDLSLLTVATNHTHTVRVKGTTGCDAPVQFGISRGGLDRRCGWAGLQGVAGVC